MKIDRRTLFRLAAAAPAATEKEPAAPDRFAAHFPREIGTWDRPEGMPERTEAIFREQIRSVTQRSIESNEDKYYLMVRNREPIEPVVFIDVNLGDAAVREIILTGPQAKRFLGWWRG